MQTGAELDKWWAKPDAWGYKTNKDDLYRKHRINKAITKYCKGQSIVDIGAGEGWITQDLPIETKYATDISEVAQARFPEGIEIYTGQPVDIALTCGTLYKQYDHEGMAQQIRGTKAKYIVIAGINDWLIDYDFGEVIHKETFPYREYEQRLTVFKTSA